MKYPPVFPTRCALIALGVILPAQLALAQVTPTPAKNMEEAYSPHHQISFNARQDLGSYGGLKNLYVVANGRWVDKRQFTEAWYSLNNQLNKPWELNSYAVFSAGLGTQFDAFNANFNASLMIKNLFDKSYLANRNYYGAPRTIELTLRTNF